jgi:hypothetical protein
VQLTSGLAACTALAIRRISNVASSVKLGTRLKVRGVASDVGRKNVKTVWAWACVGGWVVSEDLDEDLKSATATCTVFQLRSVLCVTVQRVVRVCVLTEGNHPRSCHISNHMAWVVRLDCRSAASAQRKRGESCMGCVCRRELAMVMN